MKFACDPTVRSLDRRALLIGAGLSGLASPALAQGRRRFRVGINAVPQAPRRQLEGILRDFDQRLSALTSGRLGLEPVDGVVDLTSVATGDVDAILGPQDVWIDQDPLFGLFTACPCGLTPSEFAAWIGQGGGQGLWDALGAAHGVRAQLVGDIGPHTLGWFKEPLQDTAAFSAVRYGTAGLGIEAVRAIGAQPVLPGTVADATESAEPTQGIQPGGVLHSTAVFRPQSAVALTWNLGVATEWTEQDRGILRAIGYAVTDLVMAQTLRDQASQMAAVPADAVAPVPADLSMDVMQRGWSAIAEQVLTASSVPQGWEAYRYFLEDIAAWSQIGDGAFSLARAKALEV
ncbi:MAG: hypothetical protein AAGB10_08070 [Pseudomonadota bacterium]